MRPIYKQINPVNFGAQTKKQEVLKPSFKKLQRVERPIKIDEKTTIYTTDMATPENELREIYLKKFADKWEFELGKIKGKY